MSFKSKYIIVEICGLQLPVIFGDSATHSDMARSIGGNVTGAGFCCIDNDRYLCYGESISLKVKSNGVKDSQILNTFLGVEEV